MTNLYVTAPLTYHDRAARLLDDLAGRDLNFDLARRELHTPEHGWNLDHYRRPLPPEPPGDPLPAGSWAACRRIMTEYRFADPGIVRAMFDRDRPLDERDIVLEGRFLFMRFQLGLRVGGVEDDTVEIDGRTARRWTWNYRTLQGHLEMGQMDFTVLKFVDRGDVEFRIDAFSRRAHIDNPVIRLGFLLLGRVMQVRYARHAMRRMEQLVRDDLVAQATGMAERDRTRRAA